MNINTTDPIRFELTPELARSLAADLLRVAERVENSANPQAYFYMHAQANNNAHLAIRIGA